MIRVIRVMIALPFFLAVTFAQATPTTEQQAWFHDLSPEEAGAVRQSYEDRQRMERWDTVTKIGITDFVRTQDIRLLNPTEIITWNEPVKVGTKVKIWWVVEMPRKAVTPFDIRVEWYHGDNRIKEQAYAVDRPSPAYRLFDLATVKRLGEWTVRIVYDGRALASNSFRVAE